MKKISCPIIQDILPLYVDDVVSDDTKKMVEEHLQSCENCRQEARVLKDEVVLPTNQNVQLAEAQVWKKLKGVLLKRKLAAAAASFIAAIALVIGLCSVLMVSRICIPYDSSFITIQETEGQLYAQYAGDYLAGTVSHTPVTVAVAGSEKEVAVFYCYETLWSRYVAPIYAGESSQNVQKTERFLLGEIAQIEQVYYGEFDRDYFMGERPTLLDSWKMIWGK